MWVDPAMPQRFGPYSDCAKGHVAVKPRKGAHVPYELLLDMIVGGRAVTQTWFGATHSAVC